MTAPQVVKKVDPGKKVDPWIHRSAGMSCKSCMWFVGKVATDGITDLGRCRRRAPTMNGYPVVFVNDWCGDHKLDEEYIRKERTQA